MTITKQKTTKRLVSVLAAALALFAFTERAEAQQILLTGPLAGAPAVRKLRLHRKARFEVAPAVSFSLLDEYQRTILVGARLNYHFTDWLAFGAWGAFGAAHIPTHLSEQIQDVNAQRRAEDAAVQAATGNPAFMQRATQLTAVNLGPDFTKQLGSMDWVVAPQLTAVPFRGKLALFQSIYLDTDLYFFGGPAFVGLTERKNCEACDGQLRDGRVAWRSHRPSVSVSRSTSTSGARSGSSTAGCPSLGTPAASTRLVVGKTRSSPTTRSPTTTDSSISTKC